MRFLFDTPIFVYARGREHPYREPCRQLVEQARQGHIMGEASVELVQEYAHILRRRGVAPTAVREQAKDVAALCRLHGFEEEDLRLALNLVAGNVALDVRDGVHAATALRRGISVIVSPYRGFDELPGLERVDPIDASQRLALRE
jgi:uncharacterized protein